MKILTPKLLPALLLLPPLLGLPACKSAPWDWRDDDPEAVDAALLALVSDEERESVYAARAERDRLGDELASARRELQNAGSEREIAEEQLDVAEATVEQAELRQEVVLQGGQDGTDSAAQLEDARAFLRWVEARISLQEMEVERAEAQVELAEARHDLADARVELAKAEAVQDLDHPEVEEVDPSEYRRAVDRWELAVADAETALEAAKARVEYRQERVDELAGPVPASYRDGVEPGADTGKAGDSGTE